MSSGHPYPVTAFSVCNALGAATLEVAEALRAGRSGLTPPSRELPFDTFCGEMSYDLPETPSRASRYDTRVLRMTLLALEGMSAEVGKAIEKWGSHRVAVVLGTSTGGIEHTEEGWLHLHREGVPAGDYDYLHQHPFHLPAEGLCQILGIDGPRFVISTACSSSGKALATARRLIDSGTADAVLTGGVDSLCKTTLLGFHSLGILSTLPCRPFGRDRDGISIGEGAALLLVEREGEGRALLLGVGESGDGFHMSAPDPEGRGALAAMNRALGEAGIDASQIDHINAHGTGTPQNDASESRAISEMFAADLPVISTKGYTGHLLAAGGATEAIFAIVTLQHGFIPPSLGSEPKDTEISLRIPTEKTDKPCRYVLSNSFGFGGSNSCVLLGGV